MIILRTIDPDYSIIYRAINRCDSIEEELIKTLSREMMAEIDRAIIGNMLKIANVCKNR